jgi:hypothetical protein
MPGFFGQHPAIRKEIKAHKENSKLLVFIFPSSEDILELIKDVFPLLLYDAYHLLSLWCHPAE